MSRGTPVHAFDSLEHVDSSENSGVDVPCVLREAQQRVKSEAEELRMFIVFELGVVVDEMNGVAVAMRWIFAEDGPYRLGRAELCPPGSLPHLECLELGLETNFDVTEHKRSGPCCYVIGEECKLDVT